MRTTLGAQRIPFFNFKNQTQDLVEMRREGGSVGKGAVCVRKGVVRWEAGVSRRGAMAVWVGGGYGYG